MRRLLVVVAAMPTLAFGAHTDATICDRGDECATVDGNQGALVVANTNVPSGGTAFSCKVDTQTAETQCKAVPATSGQSHYINTLVISNHGTAQTISVTYGTGTNCATGNTVLVPALSFAINGGVAIQLDPPVQVTADKAICCKPAGANAFSCFISGFTKTP